MKYPLTVGGETLPEHRREQFKDEVHEYLVAVSDEAPHTGKTTSGTFFASLPILGAVDLTDGRREQGRTVMIWEPTPEEQQSGSFKSLFREYGIYRVKGHPPVKPWYSSPEVRMGGMYLTEIASDSAEEPYLSGVIREYIDSLTLRSDLLGTLELGEDGYEGRFDWLGTEIHICVSTEYEPCTNPLSYLEAFCRECRRHDSELRQFAAEKLGDGERIAREMKLTNIVMYYDGDYDAYFAYDKYTVDIFGKVKGPEDIWLEGE